MAQDRPYKAWDIDTLKSMAATREDALRIQQKECVRLSLAISEMYTELAYHALNVRGDVPAGVKYAIKESMRSRLETLLKYIPLSKAYLKVCNRAAAGA